MNITTIMNLMTLTTLTTIYDYINNTKTISLMDKR